MKAIPLMIASIAVIMSFSFPAVAQDSLNVSSVSLIHDWWEPRNVLVSQHIAYIAASSAGIRIVDVTDAANPIEIGWFDTQNALGLDVSGSYLYVADDASLKILNIANPSQPELVGECNIPNNGRYIRSVVVHGSYAYVAADYYGVRIINVEDPSEPYQVGMFQCTAEDLRIAWPYLFVASYEFLVLDISNPTSPIQIGCCPDDSYINNRIDILGNLAFTSDSDYEINIIDISVPQTPTFLSQWYLPEFPYNICAYGSKIYVPTETRIIIYDIQNPAAPTITGSLSSNAVSIDVMNDIAYVCEGGGLLVVDVSDSSNPQEIAALDRTGSIFDVAVFDSYMYLPITGHGLRIFDISTPMTPIEVGAYESDRQTSKIDISGDYVYLSEHYGTIQIINVSNPSFPVLASDYRVPECGWIINMVISGSYAFVACRDDDWEENWIAIVNVSNPFQPVLISQFIVQNLVFDICVLDNYLYVACNNELEIADISNINTPVRRGSCSLSYCPQGIAVADEYVYVASSTLQIFNVSDPDSPYTAGIYDTPGYAEDVFVTGDYAFIADASAGIEVLDISVPSNPIEVGFHSTLGAAYGIFMPQNYAYVAEQYYLGIYDCSAAISSTVNHEPQSATSFTLHPCYPNPFNSRTQISYSLDATSPVQLNVFDLLGRRVAVLVEGMQIAGMHHASFNGENLSSGTYIVRLQAGSQVADQKAVLLK
jgi:hypothetical protein